MEETTIPNWVAQTVGAQVLRIQVLENEVLRLRQELELSQAGLEASSVEGKKVVK